MNIKKLKTKKFVTGFSLLEFTVVLILSTILLTQLSYIYLSNKRIFNLQTNFARTQENINFAANVLQKKIKMAGFSGCGKITNLDLANHTNESFTLEDSMRGYDSGSLIIRNFKLHFSRGFGLV